MKNAVFLDRDGVLIEEKGIIYKKEEMVVLPRVKDALKNLKLGGYVLVVVSNQSSVARGFITESEIEEMNSFLNQKLENIIDRFYYCPHHPEIHDDIPRHALSYRIKCNCRKPLPGMLLKAAMDLDIELTKSYMVGDMITDIIAGKLAGCETIMVESPNNNKTIVSHYKIDLSTRPDHYCKDLYDAATKILSGNLRKSIPKENC